MAVNINIKTRNSLKAYPSSKLGCVKFAIETNAIKSTTSGTNHFACTAKSPNTSAPTTLNELLKTLGVFNDANFKPSIINSISSNCATIGTPLGSSIRINPNHSGIHCGLHFKRYQVGVRMSVKRNTIMRTVRK